MVETATINGTDLAYIEQGQGQPVVFVHGGVGDYRGWELQVPAFAASLRTIAVSCRGAWPNHKLEPDEEITLDTFVEDLAAFVKELDLAPAHLVGHSSPGGFGGLLLAYRYPELLRSLVLLEPPAFPLLGVNIPPAPFQVLRLLARNPLAGLGFIKFGARGVGPAMRAFNRGDDEGGLRVFMEAVAGKKRVAAIPEETFQSFVGNVGPFKAQLRAGFPDFGEDDARSIRVPTLLVSGTQTPAALTAVTDRLEQLLPDVTRLNITGASHNMFNSHPVEFNTGVLEFIHQRFDSSNAVQSLGAWQRARRGTIVVDDRIHSTKSADGTEIAGHVRGSGRPLVLVHGGLGDGNPDMNMMLPFLVGHFRCFLMNTRGRGLSADHNDHSRERMYEDVVAFADSIGEPTFLFGHSSGATWVLGAISRSRSCVGAALYEPALPIAAPVITEEAYQRFASALGEGRAAEAALLSLDAAVEPSDDERALFSAVVELTAPVLPAALRELPELNRPIDEESVDAITIPVALLHGTRSATHFQEAIRFLQDRLDNSEVEAFDGAGHLGPLTHASEVADALIQFAETNA